MLRERHASSPPPDAHSPRSVTTPHATPPLRCPLPSDPSLPPTRPTTDPFSAIHHAAIRRQRRARRGAVCFAARCALLRSPSALRYCCCLRFHIMPYFELCALPCAAAARRGSAKRAPLAASRSLPCLLLARRAFCERCCLNSAAPLAYLSLKSAYACLFVRLMPRFRHAAMAFAMPPPRRHDAALLPPSTPAAAALFCALAARRGARRVTDERVRAIFSARSSVKICARRC